MRVSCKNRKHKLQLFAKVLFNSAIKLSSVSVGSFSLLLKQSRLRYFADAIRFHLPHYYTVIVYIFVLCIAQGFEHWKAIVINNVLEHGELILLAFPRQTKQLLQYFSFHSSSSRGSRHLIDLKSKCCGDNDIWWNNIENCDALGGEAPEVVFARGHS